MPRDQLVTSAIRFLNTPGVRGTPIDSQIDFLKKKGLTQQEISSALRSVKIPSVPSTDKSDGRLWLALSYFLIPDSVAGVYSPISALFGLTRATLSLAILLYLSYRVIQVAINLSPKLRFMLDKLFIRIRLILGFKPRDECSSPDQPTEGLSLDSLQDIQELETSQPGVGDIIGTESQEIESIRRELGEMKTSQESNINELRSEIKSVRSLLLSTSQFPKPRAVPPESSQQTENNSALEFNPSGLFHTRSMPPNTSSVDTTNTMDTQASSAMDFLNSLSDSNPAEKPTDPVDSEL